MRSLIVIFLGLLPALCRGADVAIERIRAWPAPDHTRVVFDVAAPVEHTLFMLTGPDRVVVDLRRARLRQHRSTRGRTCPRRVLRLQVDDQTMAVLRVRLESL